MNVLILGSGGREHALAWSISKSEKLTKLFVAPGNAGTHANWENVDINPNDFEAVKSFVLAYQIETVFVGPEDPLVKGVYDFFQADEELRKVFVVGPSKEAAQLEGSKEFAKEFMDEFKIPTAKYKSFTKEGLNDAYLFLEQLNAPYVLKADGLAAGKGVLIIDDIEEAKSELAAMFGGKFGEASSKVVIEEFLSGIELSIFVATDGKHYKILPEAKDYKRIGEGDTGLNTGGMGAISPVPFADKDFIQKVEERIIKPTIDGFSKRQFDYTGFVFIGLMNVNGDPYVIEYNVRMGDPETEVVLPRIENSILDVFQAIPEGNFENFELKISSQTVCTVMMVSGGYPEDYKKGMEIRQLNEVNDSIVFHAGTKIEDDKIVTNGGRVLAISSYGDDMEEALTKSFKNAGIIHFNEKYYRKDIGFDLRS